MKYFVLNEKEKHLYQNLGATLKAILRETFTELTAYPGK